MSVHKISRWAEDQNSADALCGAHAVIGQQSDDAWAVDTALVTCTDCRDLLKLSAPTLDAILDAAANPFAPTKPDVQFRWTTPPPSGQGIAVMECTVCGAVLAGITNGIEPPAETDAMRRHRAWHEQLGQ